ncbi:unnamed protein product [Penicillium pancosmium]
MPEDKSIKRRPGKERVRVTRACDICKSIPVMDQEEILSQSPQKCTEEKPENYQLSPVDTLILPTEQQAQATPIAQSNVQDSDCFSKGTTLAGTPGSISPLQERVSIEDRVQTSSGILQNEQRVIPSQIHQEADEIDLEGHYVGPSSGVAFLLRVQKRLHENLRFSPSELIFNFGDAPFPNCDPQFLVLPPIDEALILVNRYFEFSFPTHRFLHQATVEQWVHSFYSGIQGVNENVSRAIKALILMVIAQGKQNSSAMETTAGQSVNSNAYFAAAENHLSQEKGPVKLSSIQARLAQCFYLLSESRMNHCWSLFGTTARLAHAIGLNRRKRREMITDYVEEESRKRVFWCAYVLDNYMSAALGRPKVFHDEDIDQELPACANDSQILQHAILPSHSPRQSLMLASIYHAKLSRLISGILRDLYGIQQKPLILQAELAQKYEIELAEWRAGIATFLDTSNVELLQITFQRQFSVLYLAFEHAKILLYRPFLLRNLASLGRERSAAHSNLQEMIAKFVRTCVEAAIKTAEMFKDLCRTRRMYKSFWSWSGPDNEYKHYLTIGEEAQLELAKCGSQTSFAQRYVVVLEELRKEARKITSHYSGQRELLSITPSEEVAEAAIRQHAEGETFQRAHGQEHQDLDGWLSEMAQDTSPASYLADMTGWGDFDSFVLTGLGDLSHLLPGNSS